VTGGGTRPRVAFALEQVLGHVSLSQTIKRFAPEAAIDPLFIDVNFHKSGGVIERLPLPAYVKGALRARLEVRAGLAGRLPDAFLFNTQKPAVLCPDYVRARPTLISLDVTPFQYDDLAELYDHTPDKPGPIRSIKHAMNRQLFHSAKHLLPWSSWVRASLIKDYGVSAERITIIPPGADTLRWRPAPGAASERVRVLFVGGNFVRKGGALLLDWFRTSPDAARCELHLVTRDSVAAAPNVHVYNAMQNNSDELIALAQSADVFVLPTQADCFSIASIEAMAAGLPVITTDVGGIADIVTSGENGYLIPSGDAHALASALALLVNDAGLRARMGACGRARAERDFDARTNVLRVVAAVQASLATSE
jgi:glycosyltransferase involved in cell wall biosynthesis